jgi:hypothetical protein
MTSLAPTTRQKKNRLQLIAILTIVLIPVLGSSFMYYTGIGMPAGTSNHGLLVEPPIKVTDLALNTNDGQYWSWTDSGKFRFMLLLDGHCDAVCTELVHNMRQVHVRLAKRSTSLERILVQFDDSLTENILEGDGKSMAESYPSLQQLRGDFFEWRERLQNNANLNTQFKGYEVMLIDRRGNLIMVFNQDQSGQEMLDDVLFLIKSTQ